MRQLWFGNMEGNRISMINLVLEFYVLPNDRARKGVETTALNYEWGKALWLRHAPLPASQPQPTHTLSSAPPHPLHTARLQW